MTDRSPQTCIFESNRREIICEGWMAGWVQVHDKADEILNHQGHGKDEEGLWPQGVPSCTLVALVVNDFANRTATRWGDGRFGIATGKQQVLRLAQDDNSYLVLRYG